jgi:hypothetical protein
MNSILDAPNREPSSFFDLDLPTSQHSPFLFSFPFSFSLFEPIFTLGLDIALGNENIPNAELILRVILASKGEPIKRLRNMSFITYAKTVLNNEEIDFIKSSFGYYSELVIMNAYDAIYLMEKHLSPIHPFYNLNGGLSQIIENLEKKIMNKKLYKNAHIIKGQGVSSIRFSIKENEFIIRCGGSVGSISYNCKKCICALPKNILEKLTIFNPIQGLMDKVDCAPLCRIYSKFPLHENNKKGKGDREPWFKPTKNVNPLSGLNSSWSMTTEELNLTPEGVDLYQRRFETAPRRGAIVQTVTGNLVEVSSAEKIEIFNGVNLQGHNEIYKQSLKDFIKQYSDLSYRELIDILLTFSYSWDNYSLAVIFLYSIYELKLNETYIMTKLITLLKQIIFSTPDMRIDIKETIDKVSDIYDEL